LSQVLAATQTIVCPACQTHIAVGGPELAILGQGAKMPATKFPIRLGSTATFDGTSFFVMGRVNYTGWDDEDRWYWDEWLLGGSDGRLLWLCHDDEAGFVLYQKIRLRAPFDPDSALMVKIDDKRRFVISERYPARIVAAEGELTWQAKGNDSLRVVEGRWSKKHYSVQITGEEIEVYEGDYLDQSAVAQAFGNAEWGKKAQGSKERSALMNSLGIIGFMLALAALVLGLFAVFSGKSVFKQTFTLTSDQPVITFPVRINSDGRPMQFKTKLKTTIPANGYAELDVEITDPKGEDIVISADEFWHETGYDDEGRWDEKDYNEGGYFVPRVSGDYLVELTKGQATVSSITVEIEIIKDRFLPSWFFGYAICTSIFSLVLIIFAVRKK
jgi:hypothetical protein